MYKRNKYQKTSLKINDARPCETIEEKLRRVTQTKEPIDIDDTVGLIYTSKEDGVLPAHDIRTDRMEVAREALDKASKTQTGKNKGVQKPDDKKEEPGKGGDKSTPPAEGK